MKRLDGQERRRDSGPERELVLRPDIIKYRRSVKEKRERKEAVIESAMCWLMLSWADWRYSSRPAELLVVLV